MEPGISDLEVLNLVNQEEAILLTADKDFGELVFRQDRVASGGSSIWKSQGKSGPLSVYGCLVYVGISGNKNLLVINGNMGEQVWKGGRTFGYVVSQPVLSHGILYMSASDSRLYAFEHGEPGIQDIYASLVGTLPLFAVAAMLPPTDTDRVYAKDRE